MEQSIESPKSEGTSLKFKQTKMGRPSKYNEGMLKIALEYVENMVANTGDVPFLEELALLLDVDEDTLTNWKDEVDDKGNRVHPDFFGACKKILTLQKLRLRRASMEKQSAAGSIFQLKVNHGMVETTRSELSGPGGDPIKTEGVIVMPTLAPLDKPTETPED